MTTKPHKKKETITLGPKDYIVFNGGLKVENTSEDLLMEFEWPYSYSVSVVKVEQKLL